MGLDVHFSSKSSYWETPIEFFDELNREFCFDLDVCATATNAKVVNYISPEQDGLQVSWPRCRCWMNPPYGRSIGKWVRKAWDEAGEGSLVVCLLPARTDTAWWGIFWDHENHKPRRDGDEVRFVRGRLRFGNAKIAEWQRENGREETPPSPAPFPSAVVVMYPR